METDKAIETFKERINDLSKFEGIALEEVKDEVLRARAAIAISTLNLNKRLLNSYMAPNTKRLS